MSSAASPNSRGYYRIDTGATIRIFDPQRGIGLSVDKNPYLVWTVGLVLMRSDNGKGAAPAILEFSLS